MRRNPAKRKAPNAADLVLRGTVPDAITEVIRAEGRRRDDHMQETGRVRTLRAELSKRLNQARGFASAEAFARALCYVLEPLRSLLGRDPAITGDRAWEVVGQELVALAVDSKPETLSQIVATARQRALEDVCAYSQFYKLSFPHAPVFNRAWSERLAKQARDFVERVFTDPTSAQKDLGPPVLQYIRSGLWTALAAQAGLKEEGGVFRDPDAPISASETVGSRKIDSTKRANGPSREGARALVDRLLEQPQGPPVSSTEILEALGKPRHRNFLSQHQNIENGSRDDKLIVVDHGGSTAARQYWRPSVIRVLALKWVDGISKATQTIMDRLPKAADFNASRHKSGPQQRSQDERQRSRNERS